jgi:hypothetical protein
MLILRFPARMTILCRQSAESWPHFFAGKLARNA